MKILNILVKLNEQSGATLNVFTEQKQLIN